MPEHFIQLFENSSYCNFIRNSAVLNELEKVRKEMFKNNISFAPLKGGYLIDNVYKNRYIRTLNDLDILVKKDDISIIDKVFKDLGYEQGDYNFDTNSVVVPDQSKALFFKEKMYKLLPYIKINPQTPKSTVIFDLTVSLDFSLDVQPIYEMLDMALKVSNGIELLPEHFLVYMCCHHYREASNVAWILMGRDLNLIKFCDIHEYVLQKMDHHSLQRAVEFSKKYKLEKPVYYTLYFAKELYNDGYESDVLESLNITDNAFLNEYGSSANDYNKAQIRKKDFFSSIFSDNNKDEITQTPKYHKTVKENKTFNF
ncbi:MAG: nucleotidyltransferase family protein [Endomicrobium sp.]|nr:nucleotidyltransferase family protein [Endomicrobium sp.]